MQPGKNIAIKVPLHRWEETVAFIATRWACVSGARWTTARDSTLAA